MTVHEFPRDHGSLANLDKDHHPQYYGDGLGRPLKHDGKLIVPSTRSPNNLIRNGGFEDSDTDAPWWWFIDGGGRWGVQSHAIDSDANHRGGTNNVYHDLPGTANLGYAYALQTGYAGDPMPGDIQNNPMTDTIQCAPGDMFRLSFWGGSRGTGFSGSGAAGRINFYNKHGTYLGASAGDYTGLASAGAGLSTRLECIGVAPADAAYVAAGVIIHTNTYATGGDFAAAFHFDDFVLTYMGETWRAIGGSGEPAFANGWVNYGSVYENAGFRRTGSGEVELKGLIKNGTVNNHAFILPDGYIPLQSQITPAVSNNAAGSVRVFGTTATTPGQVVPYDPSVTNWVDLSGVKFTPWS